MPPAVETYETRVKFPKIDQHLNALGYWPRDLDECGITYTNGRKCVVVSRVYDKDDGSMTDVFELEFKHRLDFDTRRLLQRRLHLRKPDSEEMELVSE